MHGSAGEELGAVRLEQRGTWRLGHGAVVSMGTAVRGARRGLRRAGLGSGGAGAGRVAAHSELGAAWRLEMREARRRLRQRWIRANTRTGLGLYEGPPV